MTIWHLITSEYPPQLGGVSDYTRVVAAGLAGAGDEVHVWCPSIDEPEESVGAPGVTVHRELGHFSLADLRRVGQLLHQFPSPRRLLVQWVPHGYGYRAMNLTLCLWLWRRARLSGDQLDIMVHEPYLPFRTAAARLNLVAAVQRVMTIVLLNAAHRVFVSIPGWKARLKPYSVGRRQTFIWLPIPTVLPNAQKSGATEIRDRYHIGAGPIVGHFGTYNPAIAESLMHVLPSLMSTCQDSSALLIGAGGEQFREHICRSYPQIVSRISATGELGLQEVGRHVAGCDIMIQPYPDGVSSRRTTVMTPLALGVSVVTTKGPLTEPLWANSQAVALLDATDHAGMIHAARNLLRDANQRQQLGAAGRELYLRRFDVRYTIATLRGEDSPYRADAQHHDWRAAVAPDGQAHGRY